MPRRILIALVTMMLVVPSASIAQTTYRLKGTVRDTTGAAVTGARVHAEALSGYRGEPFAGVKEFETTANDKGEWSILGLTSGIWAFDASGPELVPQVILLPVQFTSRKPVSATGGQLSWDLPMIVRRTTNTLLRSASDAAVQGRIADTIQYAGSLAGDQDLDTVCAAGEVALLVRQNGLADALFRQIIGRDSKHACAALGLASAALMKNDIDRATRLFWEARELAPKAQRAALGAAITDLNQISGVK